MISYINYKNFRFVEMDKKYYISLIFKSINKKIGFYEVNELINRYENINVYYSIYKYNKHQIIKKISENIGKNNSELITIHANQYDSEEIKSYGKDLIELKKELAGSDSEMFGVEIIMILSDNALKNLKIKVNSLEMQMLVNGYTVKRNIFNYLEDVLSFIPSNEIKYKDYNINVLNNSVSYLFPAYTNRIQDDDGIYLGLDERENIVLINFDDNRYKNSNIFVCGSSGSGKSYFLKSIMLKILATSTIQYVIDVEGEYVKIFKAFGATIIDFKDANPFKNLNGKEKMLIFNISNLQGEKFKKALLQIFKFIENALEYTDTTKRIYIDELWKIINADKIFSKKVVSLYKTIRKKNAGIVTATQEIYDLFGKKQDSIGRGILNNSCFKFIFSINYIEKEIKNILEISNEEIKRLKELSKGTCLCKIDNIQMYLEVKTFEFEKNIIE